ncbi:type IV pilus twitching motility protein PilT [Patulibacter defluvii]|uniref:type IV pilus twitching motility protein PilT n=1 Tax=Patulibacter defluvii TaxID=3095358 RepID=UPI002A753F9E|nr:type IV pilus twitching motility protein PilT [Patulibacter sp. DM4]
MPIQFHDLVQAMVESEASDLHLTAGSPPMIRVRGRLQPVGDETLDVAACRELVYGLLSTTQRQRLETDRQVDFAYPVPGVARFRVNAFQQRGATGAALRLIPDRIRSLAELGLPDVLVDLTEKPRGLVLVTGPTGSGKSTTLAAMIDRINESRHDHILTIEDPIEVLHPHKGCIVNQRELGTDAPSFAMALKAALRQDPDVILVGEMRDLETMGTALTAAETGHLVFATLHTQDAPQTIDRVIDSFPAAQQNQIRMQLAAALQGVMCQQILPTADGLGRCCALEVMIPTAAVRNLIREGKTHQIRSAIQTGARYGMQTLETSLVELVRTGKIDRSTAEARANDAGDFRRLLEKAIDPRQTQRGGIDSVGAAPPGADDRELTAI